MSNWDKNTANGMAEGTDAAYAAHTSFADTVEAHEVSMHQHYLAEPNDFVTALIEAGFMDYAFHTRDVWYNPNNVDELRAKQTAAAIALHGIWKDSQFQNTAANLTERERVIAASMDLTISKVIRNEAEDKAEKV